jgi:hypothetical protein
MGGAGFVFGLAMFVIDHAVGLPPYWRWLEGGFIVVESAIILALTWRAALALRAEPTAQGGGT